MDVEFLSIAAGPHAVIPGAHDDPVVGLVASDFGGFVAGQGAIAVFGVEESADPEDGRFHVFKIGWDRACLPEVVECVVADCILPEGDCALVEIGFDICHTAEVKEIFVGIATEVDLDSGGAGWAGFVLYDSEAAVEAEEILEHECPVVVEIITHEPVGGWGLG